MDIEKCLSEGQSKPLTTAIVNYIGNHKERFKILIDLFFKGEPVMKQRAAWPLSYVAIEHPKLIHPYIGKLIVKLKQEEHPAIPRNILRIFEEIEIPKKYEGELVDQCFKFIVSAQSAIATRAFSITVATNICKKHPELKNELRLHLEHMQHYPMAPAIKVRVKRALKEL